ncbi:VOC family protein [Paenibacillus chitinolyticus]|uniref:VOC family protein n=1 Tax=Paenibacillus chitinolyticus TaxID=79263 RepID=A0A410X0V1_9BACL|nr:VOC family protein [Paenibacillus chitinolyticus]MCY9588551.1 VOC family protein [Paenibacillus chitinolyticus]MCY9597921.1 VOC family protein [Paenibacillus chitinolyticus]QAV20299.1 VOC family protein [Paenibacillus chitinolyticus]
MAVTKLEHVGVMVADMEKSISFYESVVGLKLKDTVTNGAMKLAFLGFDVKGETEVELIEGYGGSLTEEGRVHHLAFTVDDIEAEFERVRKTDVVMIDTEITTLPNGSRYFFFHGPDGEWVEFFQSTRA